VSEPGFSVRAEDQPAWADIVRRAERGESVSVIAHGDHVADIVPSGEVDRLRETIEVLSDTELVRDLREGWPMLAPGGCSLPSRSPLKYTVDGHARAVTVLAVAHRREAYQPR
jgi:antitoxin (DNA-binding transcriptional repressor) of toxin-antitoxin stability system